MPDLSRKNILLTGPPEVGKTMVIMNVAKALGEKADGFYTRDLRERGRRVGFLLVSLDGTEGLLAHVDLKHGPRVGKYFVNLEDLESVGTASLHRATRSGKIVILDEIGRMELLSENFMREVLRVMNSPSRVLATIREKGDSFCDSLKRRNDVTLVRVSELNRDGLPDIILGALSSGQR